MKFAPNSTAQPAQPLDLNNLNFNIVSNPSHPSHDPASRHLGAALGHLLVGNGEGAAHHFGKAVGHLVAPHAPEQTGARVHAAMRSVVHGKRKRKSNP